MCEAASYPGQFAPIRVTRGGLEPSAVLGEFSRQAWQVTSHPNLPRTTGNEAVCEEHAGEWERTGEDIFRWQICFTEFYRRNFFMNGKGRVKEDSAFKFFEQESSRRGMSYRTTHDPWPTTHYPLSTHPRQLVNLLSQWICRKSITWYSLKSRGRFDDEGKTQAFL